MSDNREDVARAINAYGEAIRGDWSLIDGRTVRGVLQSLTSHLQDDADEVMYEQLCRDMWVCFKWQCWPEHCEESTGGNDCIHMDENSFEVRK